MVVDCLVAFAGGAASESLCLWWWAFADRGKAAAAAVVSMAYAIAIERGVGEAIHTLPGETSFVAGFGVGTYVTVKFLRKLASKREQPSHGPGGSSPPRGTGTD